MNETVQRLAYHAGHFFKRHASSILAGAAAVGVIATAVAVATETPKAMKRLDKAKEEKGEDLTTVETVIVAAPVYIPAATIAVSTIACIFGANVLNRNQQAALASAYALADASYKKYRGKVKELLGIETDNKIADAIAMDKRKEDAVISCVGGFTECHSMPYTGEVVTFYDEYRGTYFEAPMDAVLNAEYHLNRNFAICGIVALNDFYDLLGLKGIECGDAVGWSAYKLACDWDASWIDFNHRKTTLEDGLECYILEFVYPPTEDYYEEY